MKVKLMLNNEIPVKQISEARLHGKIIRKRPKQTSDENVRRTLTGKWKQQTRQEE